MPSSNAATAKYGPIAQALHWAMAFPSILLLLFGEETMGGHDARFWPSVHASAGFVLISLAVLRIIWRWIKPPPALALRSRLEIMLARATHFTLYCGLVLIPLTGWLAFTEHVGRSLGMRPASLFGLRIPLLPDFGINWHLIHNWGGKLVLALVALHVAAALKHHFYDRDTSLRRMLPWGH